MRSRALGRLMAGSTVAILCIFYESGLGVVWHAMRANRLLSGEMRGVGVRAASDRPSKFDGRSRRGAAVVGNARCPGLQYSAGRGIYAGNRVCVRGWRDYVILSASPGVRGRLLEIR